MASDKVPPKTNDTSDAMARGAAIGRYLVLGLVGRGGMGDVYGAYDPELDRKIAVKLLRARTSAGQSAVEGRTRLLREAQAIARLSHPNVVVVYDVGTFEDTVFIAMEFIEGDTARYWLNAAERSWREVLRVFLAAGRGLAAAHDAGLVHRDFKPDNVMVGRDGKVRVMDFGLARQTVADRPALEDEEVTEARARTSRTDNATAGVRAFIAASAMASPPLSPTPATAPASAAAPQAVSVRPAVDLDATNVLPPAAGAASSPPPARISPPGGALASSALEANLTLTGAMLGTPAYMAPEQFASKAGDARTDQFSFCVSLYESMYGERPFVGKSFMALMTSVVRGNVKEAPAGTRVPAWIRKVLLRGLSPSADARYPTMNELLDALEKDPSVARRRWAIAAGTALLGAGVIFGASRNLQARRSPCDGGAAKLAGIWEPTTGAASLRKQSIHAAFRATGKSYAERTFETVARALDKYTADWTTTYTDACEATAVRGEQSSEVLDLRMSCLQGRLESVKALTDVFKKADGEVVEKAGSAVQALGSLDRCSDLTILRAVVKPPDDPAIRARVQALRPRLAEVKALTDSGRVSEALARARPLSEEARAVGYLPVVAEALRRVAWISLAQPTEAESLFEEAIWAAQAGGDDELVAEAAILQGYVVGFLEGQTEKGRGWMRLANATLRRIGGHEVLQSWLLNDEGLVADLEGHQEAAVLAFRKALHLKEKALGPDHPDVAMALTNLANPLSKLGRVTEALDLNQRALQIYERNVGAEHPDIATSSSNRGEYLNLLSRYAEAEVSARRALNIFEKELGPDHPFTAFPLVVLGRNYLGRDQPLEAIRYLERAYAIRQRVDPEPSRVAEAAFALAQALWQSGRNRDRATKLAAEAYHAYKTTPEQGELPTIERWLRERNGWTLVVRTAQAR
jgi:serine/threonine protein kinase/tetratricopeptide (TPR) repeat protein